MENEIMRIASSQGVWAMLFVVLLFYVLKENSNREKKYQEIVNNLTDKFQIMCEIQNDILEIKSYFQEKNDKIK